MQQPDFFETVEQILHKDSRYAAEAYTFVREALDHTHNLVTKETKEKQRHVTGHELLNGIKDFALQRYGPMTLTLLEEWGIKSCEDFGEIVFNMVDANLLSKTEQDSREDFKGVYDFHEAFVAPFRPASKSTPSAESKVS
ncbi:MAG: Minf_1886 family protein [Verrucomicrobiota bacterium]